MDKTIDMAREAGPLISTPFDLWCERFADLVRADEREIITDEWSMSIHSDLEHGVKSLNETAAKEFHKNYPEIVKFWGWLNARGNT